MPKINSFLFGSIVIDGKKFESDVIISWDGEIIEADGSHNFNKSDLYDVLLRDPELIIIGTGTAGNLKIDEEAKKIATREGVELKEMKTAEAVKEFNKHSRKRVVGIMHVTC